MRARALAAAAFALALLAWVSRDRRDHPPVPPLRCEAVVEIDDGELRRLACPDDAGLASCGNISDGYRYRACRVAGAASGPLLVLHGRPIPLDVATADDLQALPGVGPKLADRLVAARDAGPICSNDQLSRVPGMGAKRITSLAPWLRLGGAACTGR